MTTNFVDKSLTNYLLCPCPPAFILSHFHTLHHCKVEWNRLCRSHATLPGTTHCIALACKYVYMYVYDPLTHSISTNHSTDKPCWEPLSVVCISPLATILASILSHCILWHFFSLRTYFSIRMCHQIKQTELSCSHSNLVPVGSCLDV